MSVKVRTVDTGKFYLAAYFNSATATHSGAVDHYWIKTDNCFDAIGPRGVGARLHHDRRADRHNFVDVTMFLKR